MRPHGHFVLAATLLCTLSACQTFRPADTAAPDVPAGAPDLEDVLADLERNDAALNNFRAAGTFVIESPKLKSVQRLPYGFIVFQRPDSLHIEGKNRFNIKLFELTSRGNEFLIEFPTVSNTDDRYYYSFEGERFAGVPFSVSPADVAREMFAPVPWRELKRGDARLIGYDSDNSVVTLDVNQGKSQRRTLRVAGPPWRIVHSALTDASGRAFSDVTMDGYTDVSGVWMPSRIDARFPSEETRLALELRNIRVNIEIPESTFAIAWRPGQ